MVLWSDSASLSQKSIASSICIYPYHTTYLHPPSSSGLNSSHPLGIPASDPEPRAINRNEDASTPRAVRAVAFTYPLVCILSDFTVRVDDPPVPLPRQPVDGFIDLPKPGDRTAARRSPDITCLLIGSKFREVRVRNAVSEKM